ncbi:hypothetical protein KIN20_003924 [Parelaphostrongylus tenuis]|uniref:PDZ domain-containing protein n=1 Tax=Parelaphostrongylus tenuis TaxID=148309 RepID=A0AAD5MGB3_PARTN|nr:hypothetical protein KIN20_003924 [Parelaphostrongylus tenuis]
MFKLLRDLKLYFTEYDADSLDLEVLDMRKDDCFLFIAGPKDVKARSGAQLRIGDRIAAIAASCTTTTKGSFVGDDNDNNKDDDDDNKDEDDELQHRREGGAVATTSEGAAARGDELQLIRSPQAAEFRAIVARSANHVVAIAVLRESVNMVVSVLSLPFPFLLFSRRSRFLTD